MKIEIKDRFDSKKIIVSGEYESVKDCLEKNHSADLRSANLCFANLHSADLHSVNLCSADLHSVNLCSANLHSADLCSADLRFADLYSADLCSADLGSADLCFANLYSADLVGIKNYSKSHDIFTELVRQQATNVFTNGEWSIIGVVSLHRLCWDAIKKRYGKKIMPIFKKLSKKGWGEFAEKYIQILKGESCNS